VVFIGAIWRYLIGSFVLLTSGFYWCDPRCASCDPRGMIWLYLINNSTVPSSALGLCGLLASLLFRSKVDS
jgi:hypothetical protein